MSYIIADTVAQSTNNSSDYQKHHNRPDVIRHADGVLEVGMPYQATERFLTEADQMRWLGFEIIPANESGFFFAYLSEEPDEDSRTWAGYGKAPELAVKRLLTRDSWIQMTAEIAADGRLIKAHLEDADCGRTLPLEVTPDRYQFLIQSAWMFVTEDVTNADGTRRIVREFHSSEN